MLGSELLKILSQEYPTEGFDRNDVDITDARSLELLLTQHPVDIVINCAVASANADEAEMNAAQTYAVNRDAVRTLVGLCRQKNIKLVQYSSDYIFNGRKEGSYTEEDLGDPLNVYGHSKWQAEMIIRESLEDYIIIRTQWLFGYNGKNFVKTVLQAARTKKVLTVVNDQVGSPTFVRDLALGTKLLIDKDARGVFHITNSGTCSWYDFAQEICRIDGIQDVEISPVSSEQYPMKAKRPKNSILDNRKFQEVTGIVLPHWREAITDYLREFLSSTNDSAEAHLKIMQQGNNIL